MITNFGMLLITLARLPKDLVKKRDLCKDMMVTEKTFPVKLYPRRFPPPSITPPKR